MTTLYLDRRDLRLKLEGGALMIAVAGERSRTLPLNLLERIVLRGKVELDTGLLGGLVEAGVSVLMLSGRQGGRGALLSGGSHGDAARCIAQYRLYVDEQWRQQWSRRLVFRKLAAQRRFFRHALQQRTDQRRPLSRALTTLDALSETCAAPPAKFQRSACCASTAI